MSQDADSPDRPSPASGFGRIEELFHRAVDLPPDERRALLEGLARDEPEVHRQLAAMLRVADEDSELPAVDLESLKDQPAVEREELEDQLQWGHYRLLRRIGSGGMGVVWQAEQLHPIRRLVALKVVPTGLDTERVVARFEAERQTIAGMSHPNIAQVFEAGETPDGRPYFVMEFVEGAAITEYCDSHQLTVDARLELLLDVCEGVSHAHQRGVIHRDLKPSNVLVSREPATNRAIAKIIDFGISKATHAEGEAAHLTRVGEVIGTPQYMSPEQSCGRQADVDVRSDVYSLGVILYELLTGEVPTRSKSGDSSAASTTWVQPRRLSLPRDEITAVAQRRRTHPVALRRKLKGDLEWVVLKALEQEPDRRYPSVAAFAADLRRYLERRPVSAGPPGLAYRARRFVGRNRLLSTAAALLLIAIAAAIAGTTTGLVRARSAEAEALAAAEEAERQAELAQRSKDFLVDLFKGANPMVADGRELTVSEVFEEGLERVQSELDDQPALQADLLRTIGSVYTELAEYERARGLLQGAADSFRRLGADHASSLAVTLTDLGKLYWRLDQNEQAIESFEEALSAHRAAGYATAEESLPIASTLNAYANVLAVRDLDQASQKLQEALEILRAQEVEPTEQITAVLANLGAQAARRGEYHDAIQRLEEALPMFLEANGDSDPRLGVLLGNLAFVHRKVGQYHRARDLMLQDLSLSQATLGEEHPSLAIASINLSAVEQRLGEWNQAVQTARDAVRILAQKFEPTHEMVRLAKNQLAVALSSRGLPGSQSQPGDYAEAAALLRELLATPTPEETSRRRDRRIRFQLALAETLRRAGDVDAARRLARQARTAIDEHVDADQQLAALRATAHWAEAVALAELGDLPQARRLAEQAEEAMRGLERPDLHELEFWRAKFDASVGEIESCRQRLLAAAERGLRNPVIETDPLFEDLWTHPRFPELRQLMRSPFDASEQDPDLLAQATSSGS